MFAFGGPSCTALDPPWGPLGPFGHSKRSSPHFLPFQKRFLRLNLEDHARWTVTAKQMASHDPTVQTNASFNS